MNRMPPNWVLTGINSLLMPFENGQTLRQGWSPQCEEFPAQTEDDWGVLKTTAIQDGEFQPQHNKQLPSNLEPDPLLEVEAGDLLLTCAGPRARCGVVCLVRKTRKRLMVSGKMYRFRTEPKLAVPEYLEAFLRSHETKKRIDELKTGISDSGLNLTLARFSTLQVRLPPLPEQHRIVTKIEELFSELDKGIENLRQAKSQLAVYRQALLKYAFEGKLTADWRAARDGQLEAADQLIRRVAREREARYQKQLAAWTTAIKEWETAKNGQPAPTKPRKPVQMPDLSTDEKSALTELPEGWTWTRLGVNNVDVFDGPFGSNLKTSDYVESGIRVVRLENIGALQFIGEKRSFISEGKYQRLTEHTVYPGDIVFSSFITERTRVAIIPPSINKAINKSDCFCVRCHGDTLRNRYVCAFLATRTAFKQLEEAIHGVGRPRVNTTQLKNLPIPICSPEEQAAIVDRLDAALSSLDQTQDMLEAEIQKAEALRQSILKKAFSGQLVPQDPSDEPASKFVRRLTHQFEHR